MNNNNNRSILRSSYLYILIFGAIVIFVAMFNGDSKGPIADISYTEFMQSLKSGEVKEIKMQYSNSVYTITGEYTNPKEQTTQEAKIKRGYLFLITVQRRVQTSEQQSYQMTQRLKKSMKRRNPKIQKLNLYQKAQQAYGFPFYYKSYYHLAY